MTKFDSMDIKDIANMSPADMVRFMYEQDKQIFQLQQELRNCRGELCLKCGKYMTAHLGACDDCRYRHGGEWEKDMEEDKE
jgi:uncharacterized OB-fold protein